MDERFTRVDESIKAATADLRATFEHELRIVEQGLRTQTTTFEQGLRTQTITMMFALVSVVLTMSALAFPWPGSPRSVDFRTGSRSGTLRRCPSVGETAGGEPIFPPRDRSPACGRRPRSRRRPTAAACDWPDPAGNLLEVIVLVLANERLMAIHAMPLRPAFHDLLGRGDEPLD